MESVLFMDVDGVVIKGFHIDEEYRYPWHINIERDLGINYALFVENFFRKSFGAVISGHLDLLEELEKAIPSLNYKGTAKDIMSYWFSKDSLIDQDLLKVTDELRKTTGFRFFLATNQEKYRADYLWNTMGLKDHYDEMFFSGDLKVTKEHPEFYRRINDLLAFNPIKNNALFFDDRPDFLDAAKAAGWKAYHYKTIDDFIRNEYIKAWSKTPK